MSEEKKREILGQEKELDESEMEAVAGGINCLCSISGAGTGERESPPPCACNMAGGGVDGDGRCGCYICGVGEDRGH